MATPSPLLQPDLTPTTIIERVHQQLDAERKHELLSVRDLAIEVQVVTHTVDALWRQSRIKTYLPVLALRQVRAELRGLPEQSGTPESTQRT